MPPVVPDPRLALDDHRAHVQLAQPGGDGQARLAGPDDQHLGVAPCAGARRKRGRGGTQAASGPGLRAGGRSRGRHAAGGRPVARQRQHPVGGRGDRAEGPGFLLEPLEVFHRGQQGPGFPVAGLRVGQQPDVPAAAGDVGLEGEERLDGPALGPALEHVGRGALQPEAGRRAGRPPRGQPGGDPVAAREGAQVPGQGEDVAPVAVGQEHARGGAGVPGLDRGLEGGQPPPGDLPPGRHGQRLGDRHAGSCRAAGGRGKRSGISVARPRKRCQH